MELVKLVKIGFGFFKKKDVTVIDQFLELFDIKKKDLKKYCFAPLEKKRPEETDMIIAVTLHDKI
ncbi:MAG: hypothetical protein CM15mP16_06050 [Candidatus Pelagibacterales bacterium]|nr:MAG: hypothetical protein CM15mP16_06050 [Pelagibacterales bacterium]